MKNGKIYIAINKKNNKVYVGQTVKRLNKRIDGHYRDSLNHTYAFANALRKYNKEDWEWKVLHSNIEQNLLSEMEIMEIKNYDSFKNGYNSTLGGEDNPMRYQIYRDKVSRSKIGKKRPDMVEIMRDLATNRVISDEHRAKLSERTKGNKNPMYGKRHSCEVRLKMALSRGAKPFVAIKNGVIVGQWINKAQCGRDIKVDNSGITKCLKGKINNVKGFGFKFINEG